jgi:hypothetical protein
MQIASNGTKTQPDADTILAGFKSNGDQRLFGWIITAEEGNTFTLTYSTLSGEFVEPIVLNVGGYVGIISDTVPLTDFLEGEVVLKVDSAGDADKRYMAKLFYGEESIQARTIIQIAKDALDAIKCQ